MEAYEATMFFIRKRAAQVSQVLHTQVCALIWIKRLKPGTLNGNNF